MSAESDASEEKPAFVEGGTAATPGTRVDTGVAGAPPSSSSEMDGVGNGRECCPVCGSRLFHEKCKVVCRSERCTYRIIYTCAEF